MYAYLHTGHDKSFGVPGAKRQTTKGARVGQWYWLSRQERTKSAVKHDSSSGMQEKAL